MNTDMTNQQKNALNIAVIVALSIGAIMLYQYFTIVITAIIASYAFYPIFKRFKKRNGKDGLSAALTLLVSVLIVIIPLTIVLVGTFKQVSVFVSDVSSTYDSTDIAKVTDDINQVTDSVTGGRFEVTQDQIESTVQDIAKAVGENVLHVLTSSISGVASAITGLIIYIYVFSALLMHHKTLIRILKQLNPLGDKVSNLYLHRAGTMTNGVIKGQFIIAVCQGVTDALALQIAGVGYFAFFAVILSILSIIPLGAGVLVIPIGILMILTGNITGGLFVLFVHFFVVTNIDNVLRPKLIPQEVKLNSAITILAVFGGVKIFGFLGIVIGPVLAILVLSTIEVYLKLYYPTAVEESAVATKS